MPAGPLLSDFPDISPAIPLDYLLCSFQGGKKKKKKKRKLLLIFDQMVCFPACRPLLVIRTSHLLLNLNTSNNGRRYRLFTGERSWFKWASPKLSEITLMLFLLNSPLPCIQMLGFLQGTAELVPHLPTSYD